ncbi:MAG TPA: undecaprenyl-diphosphate phosphatase [Egibacteraceae bacterium]|nr:undecaprenyl-diphosphate phosphatase [Egibacteraceae bacterium]
MAAVPEWLQALILGVIQGVTEFVPVSSSGHLVLVPHLLGWQRPGLAFDVALHVGTLAAIVAYFRAELTAMGKGFFAALTRGEATPEARQYRTVGALIAVATIPVALVGLVFKGVFERLFENPSAAAGFLLVTAALLVSGEALRSRRARRGVSVPAVRAPADSDPGPDRGPGVPSPAVGLPLGHDLADPTGLTLDRIGLRQAVVVGLLQVLALCPGISRSGSTITAGMAAGMTREAATRFSFLLALPALVGAAILSLPDLFDPAIAQIYSAPEVLMGIAAAFISSYLAIRYLVALVARDRLTGFAIYCVAASAVGFMGSAVVG